MKKLLEKERAKKERLQLLEKESEESFLSYEKEAANVRLIISSAEADLPRKKEEEMGHIRNMLQQQNRGEWKMESG